MITAKVFADNREMANIHVIKALALLPCPLIPKSQDSNLESGTAAIAPRAVRRLCAQKRSHNSIVLAAATPTWAAHWQRKPRRLILPRTSLSNRSSTLRGESVAVSLPFCCYMSFFSGFMTLNTVTSSETLYKLSSLRSQQPVQC